MPDQAEKPAAASVTGITPLGTEIAPFIYFDGSTALGTSFGMVQIELAANVLTPDGKGGLKTEVVMTAHCDAVPMLPPTFRQAIDKALLLGAKTEGQAN